MTSKINNGYLVNKAGLKAIDFIIELIKIKYLCRYGISWDQVDDPKMKGVIWDRGVRMRFYDIEIRFIGKEVVSNKPLCAEEWAEWLKKFIDVTESD